MDAIILCTGYQHHFPFMADDLRLRPPTGWRPADLYKGVAWVDNPTLFYLGMQDQWFTFNMFDAQAWWARDVIMGRIALPDRAAMEADIEIWIAKEGALRTARTRSTSRPNMSAICWRRPTTRRLDVDHVGELFKEWEHHKMEGILTYRDRFYPSTLTGTMSPTHHTVWMKALDDSLEAFLNVPDAAE